MNEKIKAHVIAYNEKRGWEISDESLFETIMESGKEIYSEVGASHRWYNEKFVVVELEGMLIGYDTFDTTGDAGWKDLGLEHDISKVYEVEKKQKTVDYFVKV